MYDAGIWYFTLGNVPPKFRSKTKQIQLAAVVKSMYIKKYGVNAVLKPILDDWLVRILFH